MRERTNNRQCHLSERDCPQCPRVGKPSKTDSIKFQISSRTSRGNRDSKKKDAIKDTISDSQLDSYFPYRWSSDSLTFNIYFYLFLYLYIRKKTINNGTPHLKSLKNQNRRAALGRPAIKLLRRLKLVCGRPTLPLVLLWFTRQNNYEQQKQNELNEQKAKRAAGIEGQVATMLKSHTRQIDTTAIKRAQENK